MMEVHQKEITKLRTELHNLRNQVRGLRAQHQKDMAKLKGLLANPDKLETVTKPEDFPIKPIGFVSTWHQTKNGTPRQGVIAKMASGYIDVSVAKDNHPGLQNPHYALEGLEKFSHVWILFYFHQNGGKDFVKTKVAPPRLMGEKVGLWSTRSPHRPNPIGLTLAKVIKIEACKVFLQGLDLLDNTPILDIKPYIHHYDMPKDDDGKVDQVIVPDWIESQAPVTNVDFTPRALKDLNEVELNGKLKTHEDLKTAITEVLQEDPRSNYRRDKCTDRLYFFNVDGVKVTCWFDEDFAQVLKVI